MNGPGDYSDGPSRLVALDGDLVVHGEDGHRPGAAHRWGRGQAWAARCPYPQPEVTGYTRHAVVVEGNDCASARRPTTQTTLTTQVPRVLPLGR